MANESTIDVLEPADQPSLHNVTTLPKRDMEAIPLEPDSLSTMTTVPTGQPEPIDAQPPSADQELSADDEGILSQKLSDTELMLAHAAEAGKEVNPEVIA